MVAVVQKKAFRPGVYRGQLLSAERLRQFAEGTNEALKKGVPVPGLKKHAPLGADDESTAKVSATDGAGWLKGVEIDPDDGSLGWKLDVPKEIAEGVKDGTIRFTSPEFRDKYVAADGRYEGPIIRHVAFTPLPKAHDQGPLTVAMSEGVFQFGEDDYEGPQKKDKEEEGESDSGNKPPEPPAEPPAEPKNPDMPPKATDSTKLAAVLAGLNQKGVVLPSDFDFNADSAIDVLLAAINSSLKAEQESKANQEKSEEPETSDADAMPFSEEEIAALPAAMQVKARAQNKLAVQFAEEQAARKAEQITTARDKAKSAVAAAKLPPGLKEKLAARLDAVQFSESGESPTLTIQEAATLFAESLPPNLQFSEGDTGDIDHPDGPAFFKSHGSAETPEEAEEIVNRIFGVNPAKKAG